jgi:hypothetical protein
VIDWPLALGAAGGLAAAAGVSAAVGWRTLRRRGMDNWLLPYLLSAGERRRKRIRSGEPCDLILAVCDHYEPKRGGAGAEKSRARVQQWVDDYPRLFDRFRDANGRPPQHSFFYPEDEYDPELVDLLAGLCRRGYGEVEVHLHHGLDRPDTAQNLRETLLRYKRTLRDRHGLLGTDTETGEVVYGFAHGNWTLANCRRDGKYCGVNDELRVLRETGCYADFTLPSAPSETQTAKINSLYWAVNDPNARKPHNRGVDVGNGPRPDDSLLMIQGPLLLDWQRRRLGIFPSVENSCLQMSQQPDRTRVDNWIKAGISIPSQPSWRFVKLHTHGVWEPNQEVLLGESMVRMHDELARRSAADPNFRFHYVSCREMANLVLAGGDVTRPTTEAMQTPYAAPPTWAAAT